MENLLGKCESNNYNFQSSTEEISGPKINKYNAISNFASNNNAIPIPINIGMISIASIVMISSIPSSPSKSIFNMSPI